MTCHSGDILSDTYKNVTVPRGEYCLLLGATVLGSVFADGSRQLGVDRSTIYGNVSASRVTGNGFICGSSIGGNVTIERAQLSPSDEPFTWIVGDESYCIPQFDPVPGNYIGGTLFFNRNSSGGMISNNNIRKRLTCDGNNPPPAGHNDHVQGKASGQCAGLAGGAGNAPGPPGSN